jgi:hypothetical protein
MTRKESILCTLLGIVICIGLMTGPVVFSQTQSKPQLAQPTEQQRKQLKEAAELFQKSQQAADQARDKFTIQLLGVMAELGLKPSETKLEWDSAGLPIFTKVDPPVAKDTNNKVIEDKDKKDAKPE